MVQNLKSYFYIQFQPNQQLAACSSDLSTPSSNFLTVLTINFTTSLFIKSRSQISLKKMIKVKHHKTNTELISYKFLLENYVKAMDKELYERVIFSNTNNNTSNNNNQNDEKNLIDNNSSDDHLDTCIGIMLGIVCGDCLGSPCEFYTFKQIRSMYSDDLFYNMITVDEEREAGVYTDDTEMVSLENELNCFEYWNENRHWL